MHAITIPTLTTDRCILRAFREDDAPALAEIHGDREVARYLMPDGAPEPGLGAAWDYLAMHMGHWLLKGYGKWALIDRRTGKLIGRVGFFDAPYDWPGLELGWTLSRAVWGKGYATEAARAALKWGFETLPAGEIVSAIHPENTNSIRVAERIGERRLREGVIRGEPCLIYGISRQEWRQTLTSNT
jgi:RimJ/RimL family protein N-acetyltransferase